MKRHPNEPRCYNFRVVRGPLRLLLALSALALLVPAAASAYGWPIKPFYQQHLIRGYFNDPRLSGDESGFHFGVDISAPDGTPVYAIEPGRVRVRGQTVSIFPTRGGRLLSYCHIVPAVVKTHRVRHAPGADPAALEPGDLHPVRPPLADRSGPEHPPALGDARRLPEIPPAAQPLQLRLRAGDVPEQGRSARAL